MLLIAQRRSALGPAASPRLSLSVLRARGPTGLTLVVVLSGRWRGVLVKPLAGSADPLIRPLGVYSLVVRPNFLVDVRCWKWENI